MARTRARVGAGASARAIARARARVGAMGSIRFLTKSLACGGSTPSSTACGFFSRCFFG